MVLRVRFAIAASSSLFYGGAQFLTFVHRCSPRPSARRHGGAAADGLVHRGRVEVQQLDVQLGRQTDSDVTGLDVAVGEGRSVRV